MKVGINGFGRMGRLALRAGWNCPELEFVAINEPNATAETLALLLEFDTVQGRWSQTCLADADGGLRVGDRGYVAYLSHQAALSFKTLSEELVAHG